MPYSNISQEITPAQYDALVTKLNEVKASSSTSRRKSGSRCPRWARASSRS